MRIIVLDASVLVACLFKDGRARAALLHTEDALFVVPPRIFREAERQLPRVAKRAGITVSEAKAVLQILRGQVQEVSYDVLSPLEERARGLTRQAGDAIDWEYVALALALDAPVWTYDDDFRRVKGIKLIGTAAVNRSG